MISKYYGSVHVWHIDCIYECRKKVREYKDSIGKEETYGNSDETRYGYGI